MEKLILFSAALVALAACSSGDHMENRVFEAVQDSDLIRQATSIPCGQDLKINALSFQERCWTLDVTELEIETIKEESLALGLAMQTAFDLPSEAIETGQPETILQRGKTQDGCAHYIRARFSPDQPSGTEPNIMKIAIGVTEKPHCGELNLNEAI